jgi:hypothetical protein
MRPCFDNAPLLQPPYLSSGTWPVRAANWLAVSRCQLACSLFGYSRTHFKYKLDLRLQEHLSPYYFAM